MWLFVLGLPVLLAETWAGLKLYGRLAHAPWRQLSGEKRSPQP